MAEDISAGDERPTRLRALYDRIGALPEIGLRAMEGHLGIVDAACANLDRPVMVGPWAATGAAMFEHMDRVYDYVARGGSIEIPQQGPDIATPVLVEMMEAHVKRWGGAARASSKPSPETPQPDRVVGTEDDVRTAVIAGETSAAGSTGIKLNGGGFIPPGATIIPVRDREVPTARVSSLFLGSAGFGAVEIEIHDAPTPANVGTV